MQSSSIVTTKVEESAEVEVAILELTHLYAVLHVPTIYLIDAYGNVVLKDVDTTDLILWLDEHELPAVPRPIHFK